MKNIITIIKNITFLDIAKLNMAKLMIKTQAIGIGNNTHVIDFNLSEIVVLISELLY